MEGGRGGGCCRCITLDRVSAEAEGYLMNIVVGGRERGEQEMRFSCSPPPPADAASLHGDLGRRLSATKSSLTQTFHR